MVIRYRDFFLPSNLLSLSRIVLTIPIVYLIKTDLPEYQALLFIITFLAVATDFLDGYLSRKLNQVTDLGIILDPIADKIGMAAIVLALILFRDFPIPLVILLLYRDVMILVLGSLVLKKTNKPVMASFLGKLNTNIVTVACILSMFHIENAFFVFSLWASYASILASGFSYYLIGERMLFPPGSARQIFRLILLALTALVVYLIIHFQLAWIPV